MKKTTFLALFLALLFVFSAMAATTAAAATDDSYGVMPCSEICTSFTPNFAISAGEAIVSVSYRATASLFSQAKLTVKIEKKVSSAWTVIDIGLENNEWTAYNTRARGNFYNTFAISESGTYRALFTFEVSGTNGASDLIEQTLEYTYQ